MRREAWALWLAALMPVVASAQASSGPVPRSAFGPGEQTTYEVSYLGLPTGQAQITVGWTMQQFGREVWPLVCFGQTTALAAAYPVHDRFVSYWDPVAQRTVGADFFVDENKKRRRERYRYDLAEKKAFATKQTEGRDAVERTYDIDEGTLDLAAAAFSLRNVPLEIGAVHEMPIFTGMKTYRMKATVESMATLETKLGSQETFKVTVNGDFNGKLATRGLMTVYYTADARQLPLRAEAEFLFGSVVIEAVRYEAGRAVSGEGT